MGNKYARLAYLLPLLQVYYSVQAISKPNSQNYITKDEFTRRANCEAHQRARPYHTIHCMCSVVRYIHYIVVPLPVLQVLFWVRKWATLPSGPLCNL